jgi:hypothetical protein
MVKRAGTTQTRTFPRNLLTVILVSMAGVERENHQQETNCSFHHKKYGDRYEEVPFFLIDRSAYSVVRSDSENQNRC